MTSLDKRRSRRSRRPRGTRNRKSTRRDRGGGAVQGWGGGEYEDKEYEEEKPEHEVDEEEVGVQGQENLEYGEEEKDS